jgi:tetratricopeptide (TPR) repeat protein
VGGADGHEESGEVRELLPWLKLSLELDPQEIQSYLVLAYWLRTMGKLDDAERVLRDGLKENPRDPRLLFDLGRLKYGQRHDITRARNLWEAALAKLASQVPAKEDEQTEITFLQEQVLGHLARLEEQAGRPEQALRCLEQLKPLSPNPEKIQEWMDLLGRKRK